MKTVILCGGRGTRLGEHGASLPKALIDIGGRPVLWHLLKSYAHHGLNDFVLCLGYLGVEIKRYFLEREQLEGDFTLTARDQAQHFRSHAEQPEDWRITFAETGPDTPTGGRLHRIAKYLGDEENFCVTYGDGLADVDLSALLEFHCQHGRIATVTAVHPQATFGFMELGAENLVTAFQEKPVLSQWINGGFFVFNRAIFDYLDETATLEREPLEALARAGQLVAYQHTGFWKCMDTFKDNLEFNQLWDDGQAAWKVWP
jgi:glucose-1-phosphate cytidylyltransferase